MTLTAYDNNGRVVATTDPFLTDDNEQVLTAPADLRVTHTLYDALGREVETRRLAGVSITLSTTDISGIYATNFDYTAATDTYGNVAAVDVILTKSLTQ